ncbi:hypothetical protein, conserved [Plasmodium gonderi]|uniref:Uncharacterized protein n=1 Tax=Plasmodium gonderi TaxID=77519 RepID=A0A1Y1JEH7_PLAGO|nr:hypothetical protein, conserved [Plasmodium gonderi]GAW79735.1 hypothetical protein, conserved [Plasmodium gonderi]
MKHEFLKVNWYRRGRDLHTFPLEKYKSIDMNGLISKSMFRKKLVTICRPLKTQQKNENSTTTIPNERNSCSGPPSNSNHMQSMFMYMEKVGKEIDEHIRRRKYKSAVGGLNIPTKENIYNKKEFMGREYISQRGIYTRNGMKYGYRRRPFIIHSRNRNRESQINDIMFLVQKNERDIIFFKYLFLIKLIILLSVVFGFMHLFSGDSINKYISKRIEKVLDEIKNSSKAQNNMKDIINELLYTVVNEEKNKMITSKFFIDVMQNSKNEMGKIFTEMLETEYVKNNLRKNFVDIANYLCNNKDVQKKVYHLLSESIHLPIAINTSEKWINALFKSESVTKNVRDVIYKEIFSNDEMINNSIIYMQNVLFNTLQDKNTKELTKLFFASVFSNPEFQQQISGNVWKIFKLALSPKWMSYEDGDQQEGVRKDRHPIHIKIDNNESCNLTHTNTGDKNSIEHLQNLSVDNPLDVNKKQITTISCDVCTSAGPAGGIHHHVSGYDVSGYDVSGYDVSGYDVSGYDMNSYDVSSNDSCDLVESSKLYEHKELDGEVDEQGFLPLRVNRKNEQNGRKSRMLQMELTMQGETSARPQTRDLPVERNTNQTYRSHDEMQKEMKHVINMFECIGEEEKKNDFALNEKGQLGTEHYFSISSYSKKKENGNDYDDSYDMEKLKSLLFYYHPYICERARTKFIIPMIKLQNVKDMANNMGSFYFINIFLRNINNDFDKIASPTSIAQEKHNVPIQRKKSSPSSHQRGIAVRLKLFFIDAYVFYYQKYYFYYYYVEKFKDVLRRALGVKFF